MVWKSKKRLGASHEDTTTTLGNPVKRSRGSSSNHTMDTAPTQHLVNVHARLSPSAHMDLALDVLNVGNLSITSLLMHRLASSKTSHFRNTFFSEGGGLEIFLRGLVEQYPVAEACIFRAVGHHHALKQVSAEMERVKAHTRLSSAEITPHSMRDWTIRIPEHLAPFLSNVLCACAVSDRAMKENKTKKGTFTVSMPLLISRLEVKTLTQPQIVNVVIHQLANFRSQNSQWFQVPFSLLLLAHGTPRAVVDMLNKLHFSPCFDTISSTSITLADGCIAEAINIAKGPHVLAYDNIQVSTSPLIEQREGAPAKVQSGTVSVIYSALNANPNDMSLSQIRQNWCKTEGLSYAAINSSLTSTSLSFTRFGCYAASGGQRISSSTGNAENFLLAMQQSNTPFACRILRNLRFKGTSRLSKTCTSHSSRCQKLILMTEPSLHQRPARQRMTPHSPTFTHLRRQRVHSNRVSATRFWSFPCTHESDLCGSQCTPRHFETVGSLAYFFNVLDLCRFGSTRPAYHPLLTAFNWILDGLLLACWAKECGCDWLMEFKPMAQESGRLRELAQRILRQYLSPTFQQQDEKQRDHVRQRIAILLRDLLYVRELGAAISDGDWGRVEDILCHLAKIFWGAGSKNYCMEILHFIHRLKKIWPYAYG